MNMDKFKRGMLLGAETMDAWRVVPRALVAGYGCVLWAVISWYMELESKVIPGCDIQTLAELCIIAGPTTQHAALVTAVVGISAAVFGLYTSTGRKWDK